MYEAGSRNLSWFIAKRPRLKGSGSADGKVS